MPSSASADALVAFTNPAPAAASIPTSGLPDCSAVGAGIKTDSDGLGVASAAQLGWKGARVAVTHGGETVELVPALPCLKGNTLALTLVQNLLSGTPDYMADAGQSTTAVCLVNGANTIVYLNYEGATDVQPFTLRPDTGKAPAFTIANVFQTSVSCPQLVSIHTEIWSVPEGHQSPTVYADKIASWDWSPLNWTTTAGGWVPATSVAGILPPGTELPIVCVLNWTGPDFFTAAGVYLNSVASWVPCMVIPQGWDRASKIATGWGSGSVAELTSAYREAVPSGIVCGSVAPISFFSQSIALDTCAGDFAPSWVKFVLGWVIVLGTAALIVRRIFWSVGSRG